MRRFLILLLAVTTAVMGLALADNYLFEGLIDFEEVIDIEQVQVTPPDRLEPALDPLMVFFTFDDSGFDYTADYTDDETDAAYLKLAFKDGTFEVTFNDHMLEGALPTIAIKVPKRVETDDYGNETIVTDLRDLVGIEWYDSGSEVLGFKVTHEDMRLRDVSAAYFAAFEMYGFELVEETTGNNLIACVFGDGVYQLRTVFTRHGEDIVAYLHTT
ncbi:MAG: hypothetical protein JSV66_14790 [Trueperaceae bacterium]|nr:MAG: hypothetical protein JSV66_14790 [Trueperaceae bacterium]